MMHPSAKRAQVSEQLGEGVVATELIPAGTIVWVGDDDDEVLTSGQLAGFSESDRERWALLGWATTKREVVLCSDTARYINHSCDANTVCFGERMTIAVRDIEPGEQFTEDYLFLNRVYSFECSCGMPLCRGRVNVSPAEQDVVLARGDRQLASIAPTVLQLPQPLMGLTSDEERIWLRDLAAEVVQHPPLRAYALRKPLDVVAIVYGEAVLPEPEGAS